MIRHSISVSLLAALGSLVCSDALGTPTETQRYPFDPACAWGRISDGRGLIVRCLTKDEAERLSKPPAPTTGSVQAGGASGIPGSPAGSGPAMNTTADAFLAELVSVTADDGELPLAKKKLAAPLDRYAKCVADNGGLTAAVGQVEVRFLVRERGRAEGTSVNKFQGLTEAGAACIAQVIDRRPTGVPEAPVVGATALIRIRKRPAK